MNGSRRLKAKQADEQGLNNVKMAKYDFAGLIYEESNKNNLFDFESVTSQHTFGLENQLNLIPFTDDGKGDINS